MKIVPQENLLERWSGIPVSLREVMVSDLVIETLDAIEKEQHLNESRSRVLRQFVRGVFLGFIHLQDLYKEIANELGIDNRIALDIYQQLEQKIFAPLRREIDANYLQHKLGGIKESDVEQLQPTQERVVLKNPSPETLDLKGVASSPVQAPIRILGAEKDGKDALSSYAPPAPTSSLNMEEKKELPETKPASISMPSENQGPVVIHQKEEAQSISQAQPMGGYKHMSFGGFFGTKQQPNSFEKQPTRATIETPTDFGTAEFSALPESRVQDDRIPVSIKQRGEKVKTVHFSSMRTNLSTPEKEEPKQEEGFVDLNNLTVRK